MYTGHLNQARTFFRNRAGCAPPGDSGRSRSHPSREPIDARALAPRILAIHAHPDDLEFQCSGTLALLARLGCPIAMATMTPGDCGSAGPRRRDDRRRPARGGRRAAALLGAEYVCLEFRDMAIFDDDESRRRVVEAIRRARPSLVLTAPPVDYHADHEATSRLVRDACFAATLPNYKTRQWDPPPPGRHPAPLLRRPDRRRRPRRPPDPRRLLSRRDEGFDLKRRMLACHASQRDWLRRQHGVDEYLDAQERWSRARGDEAGSDHAEAFRQYVGHPYPADNRLLALLA